MSKYKDHATNSYESKQVQVKRALGAVLVSTFLDATLILIVALAISIALLAWIARP